MNSNLNSDLVFVDQKNNITYRVAKRPDGRWTVYADSAYFQNSDQYAPSGLASREDAIDLAKLSAGIKNENDPEAYFMNDEFKYGGKIKEGDTFEWKTVEFDTQRKNNYNTTKKVTIVSVKPNGDVVAKEVGSSKEFIIRQPEKYLNKKMNQGGGIETGSINISNERWKSILTKLLKQFYGEYEDSTVEDYENDDSITVDQAKYYYANFSDKYQSQKTMSEAYSDFYKSLTNEEKKLIEVQSGSEEYADAEEHDRNKIYRSITIRKKQNMQQGGTVGDNGTITDSKSMYQGKIGFIEMDMGNEWIVKVLDNGKEKSVTVRKSGFKILNDDKMKYGGKISIGDKVRASKEYGGKSGVVTDVTGSFVSVEYSNGDSDSYHESDLTIKSKKMENGGVIGQEIVFDDSGEQNKGVIKDIHETTGNYIVLTDDGRTVLADKELDVISLGKMRAKPAEAKKRFGFFEDGGNLDSMTLNQLLDKVPVFERMHIDGYSNYARSKEAFDDLVKEFGDKRYSEEQSRQYDNFKKRKVMYENSYKQNVIKYLESRKMEDGGNIAKENNQMAKNQSVEAKHHAEELAKILTSKTKIEPWVVAKMERATTDLSDVTHYLEGNKMKYGGKLTTAQQSKFDKVMHEWKAGKLHSGKNGPVVTDQDQAVAIAYAQANSMKKMVRGGNMDSKSLFDLEYGDVFSIDRNPERPHTMTDQYFMFIGFSEKYAKPEGVSIEAAYFPGSYYGPDHDDDGHTYLTGLKNGDITIISKEKAGEMLLDYQIKNNRFEGGGSLGRPSKPAMLVKLYDKLKEADNLESLIWEYNDDEGWSVVYENGLGSLSDYHQGELESYAFYQNDKGLIDSVYLLNGHDATDLTIERALSGCRAFDKSRYDKMKTGGGVGDSTMKIKVDIYNDEGWMHDSVQYPVSSTDLNKIKKELKAFQKEIQDEGLYIDGEFEFKGKTYTFNSGDVEEFSRGGKMHGWKHKMKTGGGVEMGSWFDENPNPGNEIKNPSKYSEDDLLKASKKIKGADVSVYDDTLEVNIEDQSYYYGYSDVEDCWTGSYHVDGDLQVSIPMDLNQFIAQVQDAMSYLMAHGGMTEHGLKRGDTIVYNSGNEVMVVDKNKKQKLVDLDKGERLMKGGSMTGWKHKMKTGGGVGEHKNPTLNDSCTITVEGNIKMQPSDSYKPVYENDVLMLRVYKSSDKDGAYDVQLSSTNKLWQEFDFKQRRKRSKNYVDEVKSQVSSLLQKDNVKLKSLKMITGRASM